MAKPGWHLRRIENGYLIHDYEADADWTFKTMRELVVWLNKLDEAIMLKIAYEKYRDNCKLGDGIETPLPFDKWLKLQEAQQTA